MADLLDRMRRNPAGDWTLKDVETLCAQHGLRCEPPRRGSHYKVSHPDRSEIITIPFGRPVKPFYVKGLVRFIASLKGIQ